MNHDFTDPFSNPKTDRFHPDGTKCTDDNGIMDYFVVSTMSFLLFIRQYFIKYFMYLSKTPSKWTSCSVNDFKEMFNQMASYNAWCMKRCLPDGVTTPAPGPTTPKTKSDCCNKLKLTLNGDAVADIGSYEGTYDFAGTTNGRDYWTMDSGSEVFPLWFSILNGWRMSFNVASLGGSSGVVFGPDTMCPGDQADGWKYYNGSVGFVDTSIQWECLGTYFHLLCLSLRESCSCMAV